MHSIDSGAFDECFVFFLQCLDLLVQATALEVPRLLSDDFIRMCMAVGGVFAEFGDFHRNSNYIVLHMILPERGSLGYLKERFHRFFPRKIMVEFDWLHAEWLVCKTAEAEVLFNVLHF